MKSLQTTTYVWQQPGWPHWQFDLQAITTILFQARQQRGMLFGKVQAIVSSSY